MQPVALRPHVPKVPGVGGRLQRDDIGDRDAAGSQRLDLRRVVRQQPNGSHVEGTKDPCRCVEVSRVDRKTEELVRLDGVGAVVLDHVRAELLDQPDTSALVAGDIHEEAASLCGDRPEGCPELRSTIAAQRAE
jgi:hypothetical protein